MTVSDSTEIIYVIDTNILFGFELWHPFKHCPDFWKKLEGAMQDGKVILLDVVVDEVKSLYSGLAKWLTKQKSMGLIVKIDDSVRSKAIEINNQYNMIDQHTGNSTADTYIVAYALLSGNRIFTREAPRKKNTEFYKIPDVCEELGIVCMRKPEKFLTFIGY